MTPRRLLLPAEVHDAILAHATSEAPHECCGFLIGRGARVETIHRMRNVAAEPARRFEIDPQDHIAVRRAVRAMTPPVAIIGVYHSHPAGPAWPSATDIIEAHYPSWVYAIVGVDARGRTRVRAFLLRGRNRVQPVPVVTPTGLRR